MQESVTHAAGHRLGQVCMLIYCICNCAVRATVDVWCWELRVV
jgi:hypothetical protein